MEAMVIFITTSSPEEAERIGRKIVEERLAACVNIISPIRSIFHWKGEICEEGEALLIAKSVKSKLEKIITRVKELHSYEVPEIIALPIVGGSEDYLKWVQEETQINEGGYLV
ncbi:MAG: divalent-cation tolerance protein CutA [candidate division KSB1 bacterium]|nr:divalent-cation tolerance protein CutA [candidate division KSB1 bacterium]